MDGIKHHEQRPAQYCLSRFGGILVALTLADIALFSYILSGYVVASPIVIPDRQVAAPTRTYNAKMKPSPLILWKAVRKQAKAAIPVIDASNVANMASVSTSGEAVSEVTPAYRTISASGTASARCSSCSVTQ